MTYIVMDLEFNQPYDFERGEKTKLVAACPFEIIQIGAVKLDENFNVLAQINLMIKPQLYKRIHPFVERITGLRRVMFTDAPSFSEAYAQFLDFIGDEDAVFCVWGSGDVSLLYKNILYYQLDATRLTRKFLNVQSLATRFLELPQGMSVGLRNAVEILEIPTPKPFHNALNDAVYTAAILQAFKNEEKNIHEFNPEDLNRDKEKPSRHTFDAKSLYATAEKLYGRKLTTKEKNITKKIYAMGRTKQFDRKTGKSKAKGGADVAHTD